MIDFVYIRGTNDDGNIQDTEEIIRAKDLIKVVKWHGGNESELCFEVWDPVRKCRCQHVKDYGTNFLREMAFDRYLRLLCELDRGCWDK